ncbi:MAG TPA: DUF1707 and DUF4190 domain-containing protein [Streptosporangiaceae bacterium]|nr:DUF1707 and DUF4190 domain-containing protein [Streptosporangiaceae bacterium]
MTHPGYGHMRASDAERERAVDVLKAAFTEGRLSQDEYTDRVGQVQVSKTYGDLAGLVHDVPIGPFGSLPPPPAPAYPGYPPTLAQPAYPPVGPYQPGPPLVVPRQRDALAVTSLAVALAAAAFPPAAFAAVGLGIAALARIRQTGQLGRNFAIAGIALGTLGTLIFIALIVPALAGG